jgi:tartrate-resistant acid phosphatase type 5
MSGVKNAVLLLAFVATAGCGRKTPESVPSAAPSVSAAPPSGAVFAVIGDFGDGSADEGAVAKLVKSWRPEFVVTTGDDNYPDGAAETIDKHIGAFYAELIGDYHGAFGTGSAKNRFWPTLGNHDWRAAGAKPYLDYFTLPGNERYYDVVLGAVHLFALDSDPHEPDGTTETSVQGQWLKQRLAASKACFKLVVFHHPPYSNGPHGNSEFMRWPFRAWGADAVLSGHDHTYERFMVDGFPYIVNGIGGADIYPFKGEGNPKPAFRYNAKHGAMRVVPTPTGITYELWNVDGAKLDELRTAKDCAVTPP